MTFKTNQTYDAPDLSPCWRSAAPQLLLWLCVTLVPALSYPSRSDIGWRMSPIDLMGTGISGFHEFHTDDGVRLVQNPTPSDASYRWYAQRTFTTEERDEHGLSLLVNFEADGHHTLELWVGNGTVRSTQGFEKVLETRSSLSERVEFEERSLWADKDVSLKVLLRKDHGVVIETSVLSILSESTQVLHQVDTTDSFIPEPIERLQRTENIKIGSFNIQVFGMSKSRKSDVMDHLTDILTRYDIVFIQEIRDSSGLAVLSLLSQLNSQNDDDFRMAISERMGSTNMKEQYAYIYRRSKVSLFQVMPYPDEEQDFERPPYLAYFETKLSNQSFVIAGLHVDPDEAYYEIDALHEVATYAREHFNEPDLIVLGDLNADCTYLKEDELEELSIYQNPDFTWQISNEMDTTTAQSSCAYDRIITTGASTDWTRSASVFRFDEALRLSRRSIRRVSDHYPVELVLDIPMRASH